MAEPEAYAQPLQPPPAPAPAPILRAPAAPAPAPAAPAGSPFRRVFQSMTGLGEAMRRKLPGDAAPRPEPTLAPPPPVREPARTAEDSGLDIPAFLRRQNNG
jgi:hypothetical protein